MVQAGGERPTGGPGGAAEAATSGNAETAPGDLPGAPTPPPGWVAPPDLAAAPAGWVAPPADGAPTPGIAPPTRSGGWHTGLDPRGWRTTIAVAALMVSTVLGANLVNAAVPLPAEPAAPVDPGPALPGTTPPPDGGDPADPGPVSPGTPVEVGFGLVLYPPAGWSVVGSEAGQVVLQKASTVVLAAAVPFDGTPAELSEAYRAAFFEGEGLTAGEPESLQVGNGIPAVAFPYTGVFDGTQVDGVIVTGIAGTTGVIVNALAPTGGLAGVRGELDAILGTLQLVPEGAR